MKHRERSVRKKALDLLREVTITDFPVDPHFIAEQKGIAVEMMDLPSGVFGALLLRGGQFSVLISRGCFGPEHRSFTLAHELGHYHLPGHLDELIATGGGIKPSTGGHYRDRRNPEEREADWFASELLVPTKSGGTWISSHDPSMESLRALAADFRVSLTCAGVRFAELTSEPSAVVLAKDRKVEWVAMSARIHDHRWARRSWKSEQVPRSSATGAVSASPKAVANGEVRDGMSLLCEWFDGAPPATEAVEEVIGLGRYGRTLTLLTVPELADPEDVEEEEQANEESGTGDWRDPLRGY